MMIILFITIFLCFLLEMILFGWNWFGALACAACLAVVVLHFLGKRAKWIPAVGMLLVLIGIAGVCLRNKTGYIHTYTDGISTANAYMLQEETDEALDLLEDLEDEYGQTEDILIIRAICHYMDGDYEDAIAVVELLPNKTSKEYYTLMEGIYKELGEESLESLNALYIEAANNWPSWLDMQLSAGLVKFKNKEYASAKYYFSRARMLDYKAGMPSYLLGITSYYMGNYKDCLLYYDEALERGVTDEVKDAIADQIVLLQEGE